jgi:hypothetical protein
MSNGWFEYWFIRLVDVNTNFEYLQNSEKDALDDNNSIIIINDNDTDDDKYNYFEEKEERYRCFNLFNFFLC